MAVDSLLSHPQTWSGNEVFQFLLEITCSQSSHGNFLGDVHHRGSGCDPPSLLVYLPPTCSCTIYPCRLADLWYTSVVWGRLQESLADCCEPGVHSAALVSSYSEGVVGRSSARGWLRKAAGGFACNLSKSAAHVSLNSKNTIPFSEGILTQGTLALI